MVSERIAGKTLEAAGKIAYPASKHPKAMAYQTLVRPRVKAAMTDLLMKAGLTPERRAAEYKRLALDSTIGDEPNDPVRLKALERVDKLTGEEAPIKTESFTVTITDKLFTDLEEGKL